MTSPPSRHPILDAHATEARALAGRYVMEREIGSGATAFVFLARDIKHGRKVAVKVLRASLSSAVSAHRFLREIEIAAGLSHPHILPIHDSGSADGLLYYVMPYVEDESLAARMAKAGPMPIADVLEIATDVGSALQYAHDHGVIHRDIKPENILLVGGVAVVADFGLAFAHDRPDGDERLTDVGFGVGTPRYMSPEQVLADRNVDARADQYGLACVVFEMLTGRSLYEGYGYQKVLSAHVTEVPARVRTLRPDAPRHLDGALAKALSKTPEERFATMHDFVSALLARTPSTSMSAVGAFGSLTRNRKRIGVVAAIAVAVVAGATVGKTWLAGDGASGDELDANTIVIAPFDVLSEPLSMWREGLMDVLAGSLDGAGPLRTVSALRSWGSERADRASAMSLARATRAGLTVYGTLVTVGADSVRATVKVLDVVREIVLGDIEVREAADRMDLVGDSLTVRILEKLNETRAITATLRGSLRTQSFPALRAFLQGEQAYRRNDYAAARSHYEEAAKLDTMFALAYRRMRTVLRTSEHADSLRYGERAVALNHGLSPRDSLLILADSLDFGRTSTYSFIGYDELRRIRRRFDVLLQATRNYGGDPEVWNELGEAYVHTYRSGASAEVALRAFTRAIEADSLFGPAYPHAIDLTLFVRGPRPALALAARYLRINPQDQRMAGLVAILTSDVVKSIDSVAGQVGMPRLRQSAQYAARAASTGDKGLSVMRALVTSNGVYFDSAQLAAALRFRGRAVEAATIGDWSRSAPSRFVFVELLFLARYAPGGRVVEVADSIYRRFALDGARDQLTLAAAWLATRGDVGRLTQIRTLARTRGANAQDPVDRSAWTYIGTVAEAYIYAVRGDSSASANAFLTLADSIGPVLPATPVILDAARVLAAAGKGREASALLDRHPPLPDALVSWNALWHLERVRAARSLRDTDRAEQSSRYLDSIWARADSVLRRELRTVRAR